jgi:hypothetical protein
VGEGIILVQEDLVPGFNIIMITIFNFMVRKTLSGMRRDSPFGLGDELHDVEVMIDDFGLIWWCNKLELFALT